VSTADPRRLLAVDIGNYQIKLGLFAAACEGFPQPVQTWKVLTGEAAFNQLAAVLPPESLTWRAATVHRQAERQLAAWVQLRRPDDRYRLLKNDDLPLVIHVEQPERVGTDRLLAAVAVNRLRAPNRPAIVVDAGTAITVDVVSAAGEFEGGVILPGFRLAAKALSDGTDLLPEVDYDPAAGPPPVVGKSTMAAIRSGLFWGQVGAVCELVRRMSDQLGAVPQVFVAGGDAERLAAFLPQTQIVPELVLAGIALCAGCSRSSGVGVTAGEGYNSTIQSADKRFNADDHANCQPYAPRDRLS
jgi:type III pantothenate kinase